MPQASGTPQESSRSRLSAVHLNVRNLLRNPIPSSVYSQSPHQSLARGQVPPVPPLAFIQRSNVGADDVQPGAEQSPVFFGAVPQTRRSIFTPIASPRAYLSREHSGSSQEALLPQHSPAVTNAFGQVVPSPRLDTRMSEAQCVGLGSQPTGTTRAPATRTPAYPVRMKRRKRRHQTSTQGGWTRKRRHRTTRQRRTKTRGLCALISAITLASILTAYLALALTRPHLGKEVHILFILTILANTILFAHCIIRLIMLSRASPSIASKRRRRHIPGKHGPEGFQPDEPVRVHLVADEENALDIEKDVCHVDGDRKANESTKDGKGKVKVPPPAYGLWRSSVRLNPNLLHWARVQHLPSNGCPKGSPLVSRNSPEMQQRAPENPVPRPPSYISEDGISYVVEAEPRSTVLMPNARPPSNLHPALRTSQENPGERSDDEMMTIPVGLGLDERGPFI